MVTGVTPRDGRQLPADFVVDASRRGELTLKAFDDMECARPRETTVGVDLRYVTALFEIPENAAYDWSSRSKQSWRRWRKRRWGRLRPSRVKGVVRSGEQLLLSQDERVLSRMRVAS
jgi:hypothetical protein